MTVRLRENREYWASAAQRYSGLALALFLPAHFWVLGGALGEAEALESFLRLTENPPVRIAEAGLAALLALHLIGGVRILMIELLPWKEWQKDLIVLSGGGALAAGLGFLLNAF